MCGRYKQDESYEKKIESLLKDMPSIFKSYVMGEKRNKTCSTRLTYLGHLRHFNSYLESNNIDILDVKPMHINDYKNIICESNGVQNSVSFVNTQLSAIIDFYDFLVENEMVKTNPCSSKKKLKANEKKSPVFLTDDEIKSVKERIKKRKSSKGKPFINRDLCIFILGCATGLRVSALANIDVDDVDFENKTITVIEKGNCKRNVYIGNNSVIAIKKWMDDRSSMIDKDERALFISQRRKRLSVRTIQEMIEKETEHLDKHITPHKMRSTCAMKLYDKTGDIYLTAQQLGHSNIRNTMIYAKATDDKRRMAADILD